MSKLTKEQRRAKRNKKKAIKHKERRVKDSLAPWEAPKMRMFEMPKIVKDDLPWEDRVALIRAIGNKAREKFNEVYPRIQRWLVEYDPVYVLSMCSFYFVASPEGKDLEAEGRLEFPHHYLEILQALALYQPRSFVMKPLLGEMETLKKEMMEVGEAMNLRHLSIPDGVVTQDDVEAYHLRTEMMSHTTAIRNWAYDHQMRKVVTDLAQQISAEFSAKYGIAPTTLFDLLFRLMDERNDLLNAHISSLRPAFREKGHREIVSAYNKAFSENVPMSDAQADEMWAIAGKSRKSFLSMLISHADLKLESIFSFSIDHALSIAGERVTRDVLENVLSHLTYRFGDLETFNRDYIALGNPVLGRPFIQLDADKYFSALWGILPHLAMDLLEDLVWDEPALRDRYTRAKAKYLEDELARMVKDNFPNAEIYRGSLWKDPDTNVEYENDLLVVVDGFALVIEAKSASVSDPARRGAPERLTYTLRELIESPSEQAHRFISFLRSHPEEHLFSTKHGAKNAVNSAAIKYYIPLGVTLSHLGSIGSNLKKLISAKITSRSLEELAPSISLTDFECVLELLPMEVEKIHYFARRREFEAHMGYEGDEMDLLGFYLDNGFNIGETEYDGSTHMQMLMKSKELDPYFIGSRAGVNVQKPTLSMTPWWRSILTKVSEARTEGWIETGFILLNTTKDDQEEFEKKFKQLSGLVMRGEAPYDHNFVVWKSGPERRRYVIVGYPYMTSDREIRNSIAAEAIEQHFDGSIRGVALIGMSLASPNYPYNFIARRAATNLFDGLTL